MSSAGGERLQLSRDEFRNITKCLKNEEFRKLFADYCEELSDPENRSRYEEELKQLEAERGFDMKFIKPLPGYVIKTVVKDELKKVFINVAHSELVGKPTSQPSIDKSGQRGLEWSIPYALSHPRTDYDNKRNECQVYDVIFHYDTLHIANRNINFRKLVTNTAVDAIESSFGVLLIRTDLKFPKLQYKGVPKMSVIRLKASNFPRNESLIDEKNKSLAFNKENISTACDKSNSTANYIIPSYKLVHRRDVEYHELTEELDSKIDATLPKELIVTVELPALRSADDCTLNVTNRELQLISEKPESYKLDVKLPYEVCEKNGTAKFNVDEKTLAISLPVVQKTTTVSDICSSRCNNAKVQSLSQDETKILNVKEADSLECHKAPQKIDDRATRRIIFPKFSANKMDNIFAFTLSVRNVDPASIELNRGVNTISCRFTNIGNGFFPCYYVFFVRFPYGNITEVQHEEWDNNLILQIMLDSNQYHSYYAGTGEHDLVEYSIMEDITDKINKFGKEIEDDSLCIAVSKDQAVKQERKPSHLSIEIKTKSGAGRYGLDGDKQVLNTYQQLQNILNKEVSLPSGDEPNENSTSVEVEMESIGEDHDQHEKLTEVDQDMKKSKKNSRRKNKKRSLSESSCDQLKAIAENEISKIEPTISVSHQTQPATNDNTCSDSNESASLVVQQRKIRSVSESCSSTVDNLTILHMKRKGKGILKRSSFERSISECSSIDDHSFLATSGDGGGSAVDLDDHPSNVDLSDSCRKTVRFNDLIKTKLFRSNTSILAQKKKNAKKNESKRRSMSRRSSEGESTDNDDKDHVNEEGVPGAEVQSFREHDSGISLDSGIILISEREETSNEDVTIIKTEDESAMNDSSKPINITHATTVNLENSNPGNKLKQRANRKNQSSHQKTLNCNEKKYNEIEFKSEMIFDIEM